jgi:N-glycosidase YbiA
MKIYFFIREEPYGWLSNFWRSPQIEHGIVYTTNEHYYQSHKAKDPEMREWIRVAPTAYAAMIAGRNLKPDEIIDSWEDKKFDIMFHGLLLKFRQNSDLKEKLLDTGQLELHEKSETDKVWGYKGKDLLGKFLMKVREELRSE